MVTKSLALKVDIVKSDGPIPSNTAVICDTRGAKLALSLPSNPQEGDTIWFVDSFGTFEKNNVVVRGYKDEFTLDVNYTCLELVYIDDSWKLSVHCYPEQEKQESEPVWIANVKNVKQGCH